MADFADLSGMMDPGFAAILAVGIVFIIIIAIALYIYNALVWSTIAKKLGYGKPWLAWIPVANLFLLPILAKKHWAWGFIFLVPIVNVVFFIIWTWNIFEQRKYPGWLSLVPIAGVIPVVGGLASIAFLVILGMVAWKDMK
jgi:hypothetical protein